jgi:hypothetical protein
MTRRLVDPTRTAAGSTGGFLLGSASCSRTRYLTVGGACSALVASERNSANGTALPIAW